MKPLFTDLDQEIRASAELEKTLIEEGYLCTPNSDDDHNRQCALEYVQELLTGWQTQEVINIGGKEEHQRTSDPIIIPFGSYRLRVHHKDADIDILCLFDKRVPITRKLFFSNFVDFLRRDPCAENLLCMENAHTPVIKLKLLLPKRTEIQIDLLFASVIDNTKLATFLSQQGGLSSEFLVGMDETSVRSVNGVRVTQFIENRIKNLQSFRVSLCALKAWANTNGIYSNALGGLGGINFALLLTYVCIDNKESESWPATVLLRKLTRTFLLWKWPKPVILTPDVIRNPPPNVAPMHVWEQSPRDKMPIITPVYPSMNSSHNVALPQYRRIRDELIRIAIRIEQGCDWATLLQDSDFFRRHSNFIQVTISATDDDQYYKWLSFCRSKLRFLIENLETRKISVWPFTTLFEEESFSSPRRKSYFFLALRFSSLLRPGKINLKHLTLDFLRKVNAFEGRNEGMDVQISHRLQTELPAFILEKYTTK